MKSYVTSTRKSLVKGRNVCPGFDSTYFTDVAAGLQPETRVYLFNILSIGGSISETALRAVDTFIISCRSTDVLSKLVDAGIYCGNNLKTALTKIVYPVGGSPYLTNANFVESDYSQSTGLQGNGTTKYLDTGTKVSKFTQNSTSLSLYINSSAVPITPTGMGASLEVPSVSQDRFSMHPIYNDGVGTIYCDMYNALTGRVNSSPGAAGTGWGHIIGSRTASNSHKIFRKGNLLASNTSSGGSLSIAANLNLFVMGYNVNGVCSSFNSHRECFYHFGHGLTDQNVADLTAAVQALQVALGRNV